MTIAIFKECCIFNRRMHRFFHEKYCHRQEVTLNRDDRRIAEESPKTQRGTFCRSIFF